ncbi:14418_t:CDS:1, partial [Funneliformis caledonium]
MFCFYVLNFTLCIVIISKTISICTIPTNYIGPNSPVKQCDFANKIRWSPPYQFTLFT